MRRSLIIVVVLTVSFFLFLCVRNLFQRSDDKVEEGNYFQKEKMEKHVEASGRHDFSVDALEFFHVNDALEVTWAHAVNSHAQLRQALSGEVMMLEADVSLRADGTPIMAHPPSTDSDLSLEQFLKETLDSRKGIKLDFKTTDVLEPSLKILFEQTSQKQAMNPVWLNADILPGPCQSGSPCSHINPQTFLSLCTKYFSSATLSVGWKTNHFISIEKDFYEWRFVQPMRALLSSVTQPITFPVRANLIGKSMEQMFWLLRLCDNYTLTIWSAVHDEPNVKDLVALRKKVSNKTRIFYDLPSDQQAKFLEELKLQT